jgi:hypothetical protein
MGYFSVPLFPMRDDYERVKKTSIMASKLDRTMALLF